LEDFLKFGPPLYVQIGCDVNFTWKQQTPLAVASNRPVARALIDHGANFSALLDCDTHPKVLRWTMQYVKEFRIPAEFCLRQGILKLEYVRLLYDFDLQVPPNMINSCDHETMCALYTFGYVKIFHFLEDTSLFEWNIRTHHFYSRDHQRFIHFVLLVLECICCVMPREMRLMMLDWVMNTKAPEEYKRMEWNCEELRKLRRH
jgi:hypothetical protein